MSEPRTEAGKRLLLNLSQGLPRREGDAVEMILAIEAEAAVSERLDTERLARVLGVSPIHWTVRRPDGAWVMTRMFETAEEAAAFIAAEYAAPTPSEAGK